MRKELAHVMVSSMDHRLRSQGSFSAFCHAGEPGGTAASHATCEHIPYSAVHIFTVRVEVRLNH